MDRSNALLIAQDAARYVWNKIGQIKYAGIPLEAWRGDVYDSTERLREACVILGSDPCCDQFEDLYHRIFDALAWLTGAVKKKRVYKTAVICALDCLLPILPSRR